LSSGLPCTWRAPAGAQSKCDARGGIGISFVSCEGRNVVPNDDDEFVRERVIFKKITNIFLQNFELKMKKRGGEGAKKYNIAYEYNTMTENDNTVVTFPIDLDGKVTNRGQGQEGRMSLSEALSHDNVLFEHFNDYCKFLHHRYRYHLANPPLTYEELDVLWLTDSEKSMSVRPLLERLTLQNRRSDIMARIDFDDDAFEKDFLEERERMRLSKKSPSKHQNHELSAREFTLTYSPKWFDDKEARLVMDKAIHKLMKYYKDELVEFRAVGEVGTNGLSHVHCFYKLIGGLKITDKNFKRAYKYWDPKKKQGWTGHQGGHHANVKSESDFQGYIEKDIDEETCWMDITWSRSSQEE